MKKIWDFAFNTTLKNLRDNEINSKLPKNIPHTNYVSYFHALYKKNVWRYSLHFLQKFDSHKNISENLRKIIPHEIRKNLGFKFGKTSYLNQKILLFISLVFTHPFLIFNFIDNALFQKDFELEKYHFKLW